MRVLSLLVLLTLFSITAHSSPKRHHVNLITKLDPNERYNAQLIQAGLLWVGSNRGDGLNELLVFKMDGTLVYRQNISHNIFEIFPYQDDTVVITGNRFQKVRSKFRTITSATFFRWSGSQVVLKQFMDWPTPRENLFFASHGEKMMWGSNGGESDFARGGTTEISGLKMLDQVHVATLFGGTDENSRNLFLQDTKNDTSEPLLGVGEISKPFDLIQTSDRTLAFVDRDTDRIIVADFVDKKSVAIPSIVRAPRALTVYGKCLIIASEKEHKLAFIEQNTFQTIDTWNLSEETPFLNDFRKISVDAASKQIFIRAVFPINRDDRFNAVISVREKTPNTFTACALP